MSNDRPETKPSGPIGRAVDRVIGVLVGAGIRHPLLVIFTAIAVLVAARFYTDRLQLRSDFLELLPRDSPGLIAFEKQISRVGGGATLLVIFESPDRAANEKAIDELTRRVEGLQKERPDLVSYVESGTKDVRKYFEDNKWLYADLADLQSADNTLDRQIAIKSGLVEDLESLDEAPAPPPAPSPSNGAAPPPREASDPQAKPAEEAKEEAKPTLGMDDYKARWDKRANEKDEFPTGYFCNPEGTLHGIRIVSSTSGMGDRGGDSLYDTVKKYVAEMNLASYHPEMKAAYAGDIPNAIAEKESVVSEAVWATGIAMVLIVFGVFAFFRSFSAIIVMILPVAVGVACAYSFATATFGYVNTSGAFLGAIILGNGVNYPIVLLNRYREFVARGMDRDVAKKEAVRNAFRAELVGASVAGIAYGSLVITRFRGFSQFGMIGFVGMLLVWASIIPLVPAMLTLIEKGRSLGPIASLLRARDQILDTPGLKWLFPHVKPDGTRGPVMGFCATLSERFPIPILIIAALLTVVAVAKLPSFIADPWEYNFAKLGSRGSKKGGAGEWSIKAEKVFGGRLNIAGIMMLADRPEQVLDVEAQILANDAKDPQGKIVHDIVTIHDLLPGTAAEQEAKLAVLERIRDRLTERVLHDLSEDERNTLLELKPPETLRVLDPKDLPPLLQRRFQERDGTVGAVFYVRYRPDMSFSDGRNMLRMAATTDNVKLADGTVVTTASRSTIFAEMIRSMRRDGPLATFASFFAVCCVVAVATANKRGFICVLASLLMGVIWMLGGAVWTDAKLNFLNFVALPITFGIGSEYPFNIYDRSRLLDGDVSLAVRRSGGAVAMCSWTTCIGYGSMLVADNQALQSFGRLAVFGEITTFIAALIVLPAMLHVWKRRAPR